MTFWHDTAASLRSMAHSKMQIYIKKVILPHLHLLFYDLFAFITLMTLFDGPSCCALKAFLAALYGVKRQ